MHVRTHTHTQSETESDLCAQTCMHTHTITYTRKKLPACTLLQRVKPQAVWFCRFPLPLPGQTLMLPERSCSDWGKERELWPKRSSWKWNRSWRRKSLLCLHSLLLEKKNPLKINTIHCSSFCREHLAIMMFPQVTQYIQAHFAGSI